MDEIIFRFYGRFVLLERGGEGAKTFTFLLPDMTFGDSGFREHKPFMTIARHFVDPLQTTLEPTFRTITDGPVHRAADFIWDVSGFTIDVGGEGGVTLDLPPGLELLDLAKLEDIQGRTAVLKAGLRPGHAGIVRAAILVGGGAGFGTLTGPTDPCRFVAFSESDSSTPQLKRAPQSQIDVIDIRLPAAAGHRVRLTHADGTSSHIALTTPEDPEILTPTVAFSNQCNQLPSQLIVDREFSQYYHVLEQVAPDRLVPRVVPSGGHQDCNRQAKIRVSS